MKPYSEYTAEELAMERLFIRWVRHPDDSHVAKFWVDWVRDHPQQAEVVESAKELVDTVSDWEEGEISPEETRSIWQRIRRSLIKLPETEGLASGFTHRAGSGPFLKWIMGIGATVVMILFLFMQEKPLYPDGTNNQNALAPLGEGNVAHEDTAKTHQYPDSTKSEGNLK